MKSILRKADEAGIDPYVALLQYRNTPIIGCDYSPAQMLFSRSLRTKLLLIPAIVSPRGQLSEHQEQYKKYFDRNTKALPPLHSDDVVRVKHHSEWLRGRIIRPHDAPLSYVVECEEGSALRC